MNIISNDFPTLNQINKFCRYINLGDTIAVPGSIDFVLGSVDPTIAFSSLLINCFSFFFNELIIERFSLIDRIVFNN